MFRIASYLLAIGIWWAQTGVSVAAPSDTGDPDRLLQQFLASSANHAEELRGASMEVEIEARLPKLKEHGRLDALRKISKVGQITYRVLSFQGDNTVKNQVIPRYLQAEQQGQGDKSLSISTENYRFRFKGKRQGSQNALAFVYELKPLKKLVGLFRGELWLDSQSGLPVLERGRLVKNPSVFFRKVDFERAFAIQNGHALPAYMVSTIDTRLIGKVELSIRYSKFSAESNDDNKTLGSAATGLKVGHESLASLTFPSGQSIN